jgi:hypothetical protein
MENLSKDEIVSNIVNMLINANQESSYTAEKLLIDKQKAEWPELWALLEDLMYIGYIEDKFIDPRR